MKLSNVLMLATIPLFVALLALVGCQALDQLLLPNPETGLSPAQEVGGSLVSGGGSLLGPWGEIALIFLTAAQNLYLGGRKIQAVRARRRVV